MLPQTVESKMKTDAKKPRRNSLISSMERPLHASQSKRPRTVCKGNEKEPVVKRKKSDSTGENESPYNISTDNLTLNSIEEEAVDAQVDNAIQSDKKTNFEKLTEKLVAEASTNVCSTFRRSFSAEKLNEYSWYSDDQPIVQLMSKLKKLAEAGGNKKNVDKLHKIFEEMGYCCASIHRFLRVGEFFQHPGESSMKQNIVKHNIEPRTSPHLVELGGIGFVLTDVKQYDEDILECEQCGKHFHQSCRLAGLLKDRGDCICGKTEAVLSPEKLQETECSKFIQNAVQVFSKEIVIREIAYFEEKEKFPKNSAVIKFYERVGQPLPKTSVLKRTVLAFYKKNGTFLNVCTIKTKEYIPSGQSKKSGLVLIDYVDTVKYIDDSIRSKVNKKILESYADYTKTIGYHKIRLWVCPPEHGNVYLFVGAPQNEKNNLAKANLIGWYRTVLEKFVISNKIENLDQMSVFEILEDHHQDVGYFWKAINSSILKVLKMKDESAVNLVSALKTKLCDLLKDEHSVMLYINLFENNEDRTVKEQHQYRSIDLNMAKSQEEWINFQYENCLGFSNEGFSAISTKQIVEAINEAQTGQTASTNSSVPSSSH